jgi:hypothetical protein
MLDELDDDASGDVHALIRILVLHADEFERRVAFAYTVLRPDADVADLDPVLRHEVREWLPEAWPFDEVVYAG